MHGNKNAGCHASQLRFPRWIIRILYLYQSAHGQAAVVAANSRFAMNSSYTLTVIFFAPCILTYLLFRGLYRCLQSVLERVVELTQGSLVAAAVAVVGSTKHSDNVLVMTPVETLHITTAFHASQLLASLNDSQLKPFT